ncbi:G patch domain-containing protein 11, partial [Zea mays]|uniref:G patch domain-containing protein 11 n=1 Tax=Zea mays TaxID=4577 RepID=UPI0009AA05B0
KKMGYDPDSRAGAGAEPVGIEIRRSRAGLGAEEPVLAPTPVLAPVEKPREVSERERRQQEEMAAELRARKSTQWKGRRVVWDYRKAERALAQLENREVEPQAPEGEEKEKGAEEEDDVITEEDLQNILSKLRDQYQYCLYCGCKYESPEVLANECSGPDNTVSPFFQHPNFFTLLNLVITSPCLLTDCFLV